jgi:hypothetical protein
VLAPLARENGVEFARGGGGFGACLLFLLGFGIEAGQQIADDKVGNQRLGGVSGDVDIR